MANRSRLDERKIEIVICRSAKCITAERSKASGVRSSPACDPGRNGKEARVVRPPPKVVVARSHGTAGAREIRCSDLIGPVRPDRPRPRLLDPRVHRKRRTTSDRRDAQQLPALRQQLSSIRLKSQMLEMQILCRANRERLRHIKARWPLPGFVIQGGL